MCILIVRRMIADWWNRRRKTRRKVLRAVVFEYLEDPGAGSYLLGRLTVDDKQDIRDMAEDLVSAVRGAARDNLLQMIKDLGGIEGFCEVLAGGHVGGHSSAWPVAANWYLPMRWGGEDHRLRAVASLALFDDPRAVQVLTAGLADRSPRVRLAAAHALVDLGAEGSVRQLVERLDIGDEIRSRGARELFRVLATRRADEMMELLDADLSDTVKVLLLYGLAGTRDTAILPVVAARFESPSVDVRAECLRTLTMVGHPDAAPMVLAGLADESWVVRAQAAIAAGTIGVVEALPALVGLLGDPEWWVRFRAAQAPARSGTEGRAILIHMAGNEGAAKEIASAVLAEAGVER
jgi:HEAT repeat protein